MSKAKARECPNCRASCRNCSGPASVGLTVFRSESDRPIEVSANAVASRDRGGKPRHTGWLRIKSGPELEATLHFHNFEDARRLARAILAKTDAAEASLSPGSCPSAGCQVPLAEHPYDHAHHRLPSNGAGSAAPANGAG